MQRQKRPKKCNNIQKKFWSRGPGRTSGTKGPRSRGPGRTGPRDLEGPVVLAGQDLETLKVPGLFLKVPGPPGLLSREFALVYQF